MHALQTTAETFALWLPGGKVWGKCICFDFKEFFHLHMIVGSVTFIEDLNNTFQHRPVK